MSRISSSDQALFLSRDGFTVHTHEDGENAMDKSAAQRPDMIILDVIAARQIRFDILAGFCAQEPATGGPFLSLMLDRNAGRAKDRECAHAAEADCVYEQNPFPTPRLRPTSAP